MKLIQESMNGIRLVKYLANLKKGEIANAKDISREVGVPVKFALKILRILRKNEIVESYRGITGGYELKKEVDVYEIIKALQGDLYITNDFKEKERFIFSMKLDHISIKKSLKAYFDKYYK